MSRVNCGDLLKDIKNSRALRIIESLANLIDLTEENGVYTVMSFIDDTQQNITILYITVSCGC